MTSKENENIDDSLFATICDFVREQVGLTDEPMNRDTTLLDDLGVDGDDASDLLMAFIKRFNVEVVDFNIDKYFGPEGMDILGVIRELFLKRKQPPLIKMTLGDLENAIISGLLQDANILANKQTQ